MIFKDNKMVRELTQQETIYIYGSKAITETVQLYIQHMEDKINNSVIVDVIARLLLFFAGAFLSNTMGSFIFDLLGTSSNVFSNECLGVSFTLLTLLIARNYSSIIHS
jgi:hypothetical protein